MLGKLNPFQSIISKCSLICHHKMCSFQGIATNHQYQMVLLVLVPILYQMVQPTLQFVILDTLWTAQLQ